MSRSNLGLELDHVFDHLDRGVLDDVAWTALWPSVRSHPETSTCACPVMETLARLHELGYEVVKREDPREGHG